MRFIFLLIFLASCTSKNVSTISNLNFNNDLTYDEFNSLLIEYNKISEYPSLNE